MNKLEIAPSLAAAPLANLAELVKELERVGADLLHIDLEDGKFVPGVMNLGIRLIEQLRPMTTLPLDVHLMVSEPELLLPALVEAGATHISVHFEATKYPRRTLRMIRDSGSRAGLAFNPKTPLPNVSYLLPLVDYIDVLTTEPELPDWPFLPEMLEKVRALAEVRSEREASFLIEVDGGVSAKNAHLARLAGADILVAGRAVFEGGKLEQNIKAIREAASTGSEQAPGGAS
jgi:ribulose-phosphate 3-epimerase